MTRTRSTFTLTVLAVLGIIGAGLTGTAGEAAASRVVVTGNADIRVWIDDSRDVYPGFDDVVVTLRADRDCYATVFVVDTDGYVHVVRPLSPWNDAWLAGGRTYRYSGYQLGLAGLAGRGVVHVFAVSSPYPFDYSPYGEAIFAGRFGIRIYGDPFIACREIMLAMMPAACGPDVIGVSVARFYIREWTRYPGYLCRGHAHGVHVRVGDYCRRCAAVYDGYRLHLADPYVVIHPRATFHKRPADYAEVKRSTVKYKSTHETDTRREAVAGWSRPQGRRVTPAERAPAVKSRVVSRKQAGDARILRGGDSRRRAETERTRQLTRERTDSKSTGTVRRAQESKGSRGARGKKSR